MAKAVVRVVRAECCYCRTITSSPLNWKNLKECTNPAKERTHIGFCHACAAKFGVEDAPPSTMY